MKHLKKILLIVILSIILVGSGFVYFAKANVVLDEVGDITVRIYQKGCTGGLYDIKLPDMNVLSIDGDNVTVTIGGTTQQTITKVQALKYINSFGGYK